MSEGVCEPRHEKEARNIVQWYAIFSFCVKLGDNATTTYGKLQQVFGDDAMSKAEAFRWQKMFSEGRILLEGEQRSGWQSATWTGDNTAQVRELVRSDRRLQSGWLLMKWTWTGKLFIWYWVKNWGWEKFVPRWCPGISPSNSRLSAVFDIQMHYSEAAASLLTWSRTLRLLFISKSKISSERTPFWVNRRHPEGYNAGIRWRPTKYIPGMLQRMAAPLEKVCADTRDALWRWPHRSWWINKIKLFFGTSLITLLSHLVLLQDAHLHHLNMLTQKGGWLHPLDTI